MNEYEKEQVFILDVEKYCDIWDAKNTFWIEMNRKYGPDFEAVFAREFDRHFPNKSGRKLFIRKWGTVVVQAKNRFTGSAPRETVPARP